MAPDHRFVIICVSLAGIAALQLLLILRSRGFRAMRNELQQLFGESRDETLNRNHELRAELTSFSSIFTGRLDRISDLLDQRFATMATFDREQSELLVRTLNDQVRSNRDELTKLQSGVDGRLRELQQSNEAKLEQMRATVDEKLHATLEKRLGESFQHVSRQLESVQRGLGEMQTLAADVGNLNRVLSNVKTRGILGETQLEAILEQILTPEQYVRDYRTGEGRESVEFAIRLPGGNGETPVFLPIDAKFPKEGYERLIDASERGDKSEMEIAKKDLLARLERCAKDIAEKYIVPPHTTNFAVMFLPTEGLYAEALREPGFHDRIQHRYNVIITGPTTLSALLNSLRMGFQTLAIEKRSAEVWQVLGAVRTEFNKFGAVLDKVKRQLGTASKSLDEASARTRAMERKLRNVEAAPSSESTEILELDQELPNTNSYDPALLEELDTF